LLAGGGLGIGSLALSWLLSRESCGEPVKPALEPRKFDLLPKSPDKPARATAMISLWMQGGPSHIDLFDPKPALDKLNGEKLPGEVKYDNAAQASAKVLASPWKFSRHGECGTEISELLPHTAGIVDEITLLRSMHTGVNNHGQSIQAMNTGRILSGRPVLGSWFTYALGAETDSLPAYMALIDPGQLPVLGVENWSNGYLPALYQGTVVRPRVPRILNLDPPKRLQGPVQGEYLAFLEQLNRQHLEEHPGELDLEARIASYELAAKMQTAAKEALDLSGESEETKRLYGLDEPATADYGSRCLIARRLVERGVRFVQVFTENQLWDHHGSIRTRLPAACQKVDKPAAALVLDLKRRGLLDSTIVHWGGEMGRLPVVQNDGSEAKVGRDHNTYGFSMWLAGGGFKAGCAYGETDEFGHRATENIVNHYDYHATLMHLFGLEPESLSFEHNGQKRTLLDGQPGRVVKEILA
jgi:hypothetical protein